MASTSSGKSQTALQNPPDSEGGRSNKKRRQRNRPNRGGGAHQRGGQTTHDQDRVTTQTFERTQGAGPAQSIGAGGGPVINQQSQHNTPEATFVPSVQKLFDSASSGLTVTIKGDGSRKVTHLGSPPAATHGYSSGEGGQPQPMNVGQRSQRGQYRQSSESSQGSATHREMDPSWPSLGEAMTHTPNTGELKDPKYKSPKKSKNKNRKQGKNDAFCDQSKNTQTPTATKSAPELLMKVPSSGEDKVDQKLESGNQKVQDNSTQRCVSGPVTAATVTEKRSADIVNTSPANNISTAKDKASRKGNASPANNMLIAKDKAGNIENASPADNAPTAEDKTGSNIRNEKPTATPLGNEWTRFLENYRSEVGAKYIALLDVDYIRPLSKKNPKFPKACFFCRLCEFHMNSAEDMEEHRKFDDGHIRRTRIKSGNAMLKNMPPPTEAHVEALSNYLDKLYTEIVLSEEEVQTRKSTIDILEKDLQEHSDRLKGVRLQLCGSLRAGFALKESDTNIRILAPKTANLAHVMTEIYDVLNALEYKDVVKDFTAKDPFVSFSDDKQTCRFCLQFSEEGNQITNMLLSCYTKWNVKLKQLAVLFKHMAKIGQISDAARGALASYCYPIMVIFFCQQMELVPVLFQNLNMETMVESEFQGEVDSLRLPRNPYAKNIEEKSLGELWLLLLKFYSFGFNVEQYLVSIMSRKPVTKSSRTWSTRRLAIEDPGIPKRNLCKSVSHQRVFDFINDQIRKVYKYFAIPQLESGPAFTMLYTPYKAANEQTSKDSNHKTKDTPKIPGPGGTVTPEKGTVDVAAPVKNSGSSGGDSNNSTGAEGSAGAVSVETLTGPEQDTSDVELESSGVRGLSTVDDSAHSPTNKINPNSTENCSLANKECKIPSLKRLSSLAVPPEHQDDSSTSNNQDEANSSSVATTSQLLKTTEEITAGLQKVSLTDSQTESPPKPQRATGVAINDELLYDKEKVDKLRIEDFCFDFNSKHLTIRAQKLPVFCRQCSKANHVVEDCPDEQLPPCVPLPPPSKNDRKLLSDLLNEIKEQNELCDENKETRNEFVIDLTNCIRRAYPDAELTLYGSSSNGFGSAGSDLDICMTRSGISWLYVDETRKVIKKVAEVIASSGYFQDVLPLINAKVPIVKCTSIDYGLEADISLYNILAQRNTQMLYRYSQIDRRVRTLGYTVKEFAKSCDIGDASKGSLSSYAYIIMLIYYLQQCDPPVLPVLQQMYKGDTKPEVIVEDWDTWFYDASNEQLAKDWPGYNKNEMDVAQLWLGFLDFYAQRFPYKSDVVSIRQVEKMSKFEKLWNSETLAIEDPFDLKRNLGAALSKRMNAYILTTFIKARAVFHTSLDKLPLDQRPSAYKFYFGHEDLPGGGGERAPEHVRACRICGKLGHYAKLCPVKTQKKERQNKLRDMRLAAQKKAAQENREMERRLSETDNYRRGTPPRQQQRQQQMPQQFYGSPGRYQQSFTPPKQSQPGLPNQRPGQRQPPPSRYQGNMTHLAHGNNAIQNQNNSNIAGQNLAFPVLQGNVQLLPHLQHQQQFPTGQIYPMGSPVSLQDFPIPNPQSFHQSMGRQFDYHGQ